MCHYHLLAMAAAAQQREEEPAEHEETALDHGNGFLDGTEDPPLRLVLATHRG